MNDGAIRIPLISCVIVNWNTRELLLQSIDSIEAWFTSVTYEVIVVDNASSDGSVDEVGMMDEQFQLFFEDVAWFFRMRQRGWRLLFYPEIA